jgi:hypothetical protein
MRDHSAPNSFVSAVPRPVVDSLAALVVRLATVSAAVAIAVYPVEPGDAFDQRFRQLGGPHRASVLQLREEASGAAEILPIRRAVHAE